MSLERLMAVGFGFVFTLEATLIVLECYTQNILRKNLKGGKQYAQLLEEHIGLLTRVVETQKKYIEKLEAREK